MTGAGECGAQSKVLIETERKRETEKDRAIKRKRERQSERLLERDVAL